MKILQNIFSHRICLGLLVTLGLAVQPGVAAAAIDLADAPLFSTITVPGNLALTLSVEWPTATTPAYPASVSYSASTKYLGYFDPKKCYQYIYDSLSPSSSYFAPYSVISGTTYTCTSSSSLQLWSGNFMNWVSMQTLDTFRWVLTGGYRSVDTASSTILSKTYASYDSSVMPDKAVSTTSILTGATPLSNKWSSWKSRLRNIGTAMYFTKSGDLYATTGIVDYDGHNGFVSSSNSKYAQAGTVYRVYINVKVCDSGVGIEDNCVAYGTNYKPEGLMQSYSMKLRYSALSYYNDGDTRRDGGVLRAGMKYIGPKQPVPGSDDISNSLAEWDGATGIMGANPSPAEATATQTFASSSGYSVSITNSGVMNYLNKFGSIYPANSYKSQDNVSELYYTATRYFRNIGNVPIYSSLTPGWQGSGTTATNNVTKWLDGFPAVTDWRDPILYSCQKNFVLGIGDVYSHKDANLPGAYSSLLTSYEPTMPSEVTADTWVDVTKATNMIGQMEGYTGLGTVYNSCGGTGRRNTNYIAGLAYHAHTSDLRSDLAGTQTLSTYWMDVNENSAYCHKNQYWLATKYGGFSVPSGFAPYASTNGTSTIGKSLWATSSDTLPTSGVSYQGSYTFSTDAKSNSSDARPDNYFSGNTPDAMRTGLTNAFAKIASEAAGAVSTTISLSNPNQSSSGNANYKASYNPVGWVGALYGQTVSYAASGVMNTPVTIWDASALLLSTTPSNRKIVTCCSSSGSGLVFQSSTLAAGSLSSRTTYSTFANVSGVDSGSQNAANYLAYLRGDRSKELSYTSGVYRTRTGLLGDIVNSGVTVVAPPAQKLSELKNPGYAAFKSSYASRKTVVYVGANDGMLHAFDGTVSASGSVTSGACSGGGCELFAYVPSFVYGSTTTGPVSGLASIGAPNYAHHNMVDATPEAFELDFKKTYGSTAMANDWRTLLIGGLGKGGKGYYALDVTDPSSWTTEANVAGKVLWEFTDSRMGYSYGNPVVVKTAKYGWVVVLNSGYNNSDGKGYLFFVNPRTGALLETVTMPEASSALPLNLSKMSAYSPNLYDGTVDALYVGDIAGNVWRLDLTPSNAAYSYADPVKIARLVDAGSSNGQPVTTRPLIEVDSTTGYRYLLVATGRLLADSDITDSQRQTIYAIRDGKSASGEFYTSSSLPTGFSFPISRANLVANSDLLSDLRDSVLAKMGWYYDLSVASNGTAERVNVDPVSTQGIAAIAINLPNGDVCSPAGTSRTVAMTLGSGQSVLRDSAGNLITSFNSGGSANSVELINQGGTIYVQVGDTTGNTKPAQPDLSSNKAVKRISWRVLPATE